MSRPGETGLESGRAFNGGVAAVPVREPLSADAAVSAPAGSWFTSLVPSRLVDTRSSVAVAAGGQLDLSVLGRGGVPASGVGAVVLNVTATDAVSSGYLTVWPKGDGDVQLFDDIYGYDSKQRVSRRQAGEALLSRR